MGTPEEGAAGASADPAQHEPQQQQQQQQQQQSTGESVDLDLDAVVDLDARWYEEGRVEGAAAGRARGREEGLLVGKAKGFEIGCELGYYAGCAAAWLEAIRRWNERGSEEAGAGAVEGAGAAVEKDAAPPAENVERATRTLEGILQQVADFPQHNAPDEDLVDRLQRLRAKFRAAASMVGVSVAFNIGRRGGAGAGGGAGDLPGGAGAQPGPGGLSF